VEHLDKYSTRELYREIIYRNIISIFDIPASEKRTYTVEQFAQRFSKVSDELISFATKKEGLLFVSGKLILTCEPDGKSFMTEISAYYQKKNGEWVHKSGKEKVDISCLTAQAQKELHELKVIEFELTEPK
jgi:hypothetical protein